jgi:hypothetical protein
MSYVIFRNNGVIDERAMRTFGVSAKETENPIGFFGTGLKYALAILIRENQHVQLFSGGQHFVFQKKIIEMRGQSFEAITMNGEELPFTTKLGQNWDVWQAFRELWCNCLDEKGEVLLEKEIIPDSFLGQDKTYFIVSGDKFLDAFFARNEIILSMPDSLKIGTGRVDVYNHPSKHLYYRGIRVYDFPTPTMFTYNLLASIDLTEDRTLKYPSVALDRLGIAVASLKDKHLIRQALLAPQEYAEKEFSYTDLNWNQEMVSEEFFEVLEREYKNNNDRLNKSARSYLIKRINKAASKHYEPDTLTAVEQKQIDRAVTICNKVWPDFSNYKIMVVKSLGQSTMALADANENTMVLSKEVFRFGTKYLTATLIEEYMHLKTTYGDCTRELQTHLFDSICTLIENHVLNEPI